MAGRMQGKVAFVTGGGSGIGAATAQRLAQEGATVVVCGRRREPLDEVAAGIVAAGGKAEAVFFVNPTRIEQVKDIAAVGEKMPQKSTFFYPKLFSGVTINKLPIEPIRPTFTKPNFQECSK